MSIVSIYPVSNYGPDGGLAGLEVLNASTVIGEAIKKVVDVTELYSEIFPASHHPHQNIYQN